MLPTLKLFYKQGCPNLPGGVCERPHCPFNHSSKVSKASNSAELLPEESEEILELQKGSPNRLIVSKRKGSTSSAQVSINTSDINEGSRKKRKMSSEEKAEATKTLFGENSENSSNEDEDDLSLETESSNNAFSFDPLEETNFIDPSMNEVQGSLEDDSHDDLGTMAKDVDCIGSGSGSSEGGDDDVEENDELAEQFRLPEDIDTEDANAAFTECLKVWSRPDCPGRQEDNNLSRAVSSSETGSQPSTASTSSNYSIIGEASSSANVDSRLNLPGMNVHGKQRIAHTPGSQSICPIPRIKKLSPAEIMRQRYESSASASSSNDKLKEERPKGSSRLAHTPRPNNQGVASDSTNNSVPKDSTHSNQTIAHTNEKGSIRKAHIPSQTPTSSTHPIIPKESISLSKIPVNARQRVVDQLFRECERIYSNRDDAIKRALEEELTLAKKHKAKQVYICTSANCLKRLRQEANLLTEKDGCSPNTDSSKDKEVASSANQSRQVQSHERILNGPSKYSWSVENKKQILLSSDKLYRALKSYVLTKEQIAVNGYPLSHPSGEKGHVFTRKRNGPNGFGDPRSRVCDRCSKRYFVDFDGIPIRKESCFHHTSKLYKSRGPGGSFEGKYNCCDGDSNSQGCCVANCHVSNYPATSFFGFVSAVKDPLLDGTMGCDPWDVVALDCEMVYTTFGSELARATFVSVGKEILYDTFVKPSHPIIDYNTKYSGINENTLKGVTTTLTDVQAILLTRIRPNTILIGHSLESDLIALKLKHDFVIDTSVLLPHRRGPPFKRALRNLASEHLGKIIQNGEEGHDSAEDAVTALEIVLWKVQNDKFNGQANLYQNLLCKSSFK